MSAKDSSALLDLALRPWRALSASSRAPIIDPVNRRNAPMVQLVVLALALAPPTMWLYRIVFSDLPWRNGETASLIMSLVLSAIAVSNFVLIRRGRFRLR
ncbi:MAG: hypothetical protein ABI650_02480 [Dokdonella sp.]